MQLYDTSKLETAIVLICGLTPYFYEENGCIVCALGRIDPISVGYLIERSTNYDKLKYSAMHAVLIEMGELMESYEEFNTWVLANDE